MKILPQKGITENISKESLFLKVLSLLVEVNNIDLTSTEIQQITDLLFNKTISKRSFTILSNKGFILNNKPHPQFESLFNKLEGDVTIQLNYNVTGSND